MNKSEFLKSLEKALRGLPQEDIRKSLDFYGEMIDDCIEDGASEKDAVSQIGGIDEIAKHILADIPITKLVKQKIKPQRRMGAGEIVLLALGAPIWLSLLIAAFAIVISVYASLWAVVISLWACEVAFGGSILGCVAAVVISFIMGQNVYAIAIVIAAALFLVGFSILFFFVCKFATLAIAWLTKTMALSIKSLFLRKE